MNYVSAIFLLWYILLKNTKYGVLAMIYWVTKKIFLRGNEVQ